MAREAYRRTIAQFEPAALEAAIREAELKRNGASLPTQT
jgi:hypothetical protein